MNNPKNTGIKKIGMALLLATLPSITEASGILEKQNIEAPISSINLKSLYGERLRNFIRESLNNTEKNKALCEALSQLAKEDPREGGSTYYCVAAKLRDFVRDIVPESICSLEEKTIAEQQSAHYFVKALLMGDETARVILLVKNPKVRNLLNQICNKEIQVNAAIIKLLESIALKFLVHKSPTKFYL